LVIIKPKGDYKWDVENLENEEKEEAEKPSLYKEDIKKNGR